MQTYAARKNHELKNSHSNLVSVDERYRQTLAALPLIEQEYIENAISDLAADWHSNKNNGWPTFSHMPLCTAKTINLKKVRIDTSYQRMLSLRWVVTILRQFIAHKVMPINVYEDPDTHEHCIWDGQHTTVALWVIATRFFGIADLSTVEVPAAIYSASLRSEIREMFIDLNTHTGNDRGKTSLAPIDLWSQHVYGVRIDQQTKAHWVACEKKQQVLDQYDFFVTDEKMGDHDQPGAISRFQEINSKDMDAELLEKILQFLTWLGADQRPVDPKEMHMAEKLWLTLYKQRVKVTPAVIKAAADTVNHHWQGRMDHTSRFWDDVFRAYREWHSEIHGSDSRSQCQKTWNFGGPFLIEQIKLDHKDLADCLPSIYSNGHFKPFASSLL